MRYCCDRFQLNATVPREKGLNIRIIKFGKDELLDSKQPYRFFITPGYGLDDKGVSTLNIAFCPFCGKDLFKFYNSDEYINEHNSDFLYFK